MHGALREAGQAVVFLVCYIAGMSVLYEVVHRLAYGAWANWQ